MMRIAVAYIEPEPTPVGQHWLSRSPGAPGTCSTAFRDSSEASALPDVELIAACLEEAGHEALLLPAQSAAQLAAFAARRKPDLVFNTCDSFAGRAALEMNVAALFELFGVPCTGSPALTLGLAQNKALAKAVLHAQGVPTPGHVLLAPGQDPAAAAALGFPLIVKPVAEDASIGIDDGAVVHDQDALDARVRFVWREFRQDALVETFIDGREFHVSLLAASRGDFTVLPIGEPDFSAIPAGRARILGYDAKWDPAADFGQLRGTHRAAAIDAHTARRIGRCALDAARSVGLRDYGRVDLRLRAQDQAPLVLEVNPNPDLSTECAFAGAARASGRSYGATIREIAERALQRSRGAHAARAL